MRMYYVHSWYHPTAHSTSLFQYLWIAPASFSLGGSILFLLLVADRIIPTVLVHSWWLSAHLKGFSWFELTVRFPNGGQSSQGTPLELSTALLCAQFLFVLPVFLRCIFLTITTKHCFSNHFTSLSTSATTRTLHLFDGKSSMLKFIASHHSPLMLEASSTNFLIDWWCHLFGPIMPLPHRSLAAT